MKVDSVGAALKLDAGSESHAVLLENRVGIKNDKTASDPKFDNFYSAFMSWAGADVGDAEIKKFIKEYVADEGEPVYRTNKQQAAALASVLSKMKELQLESDALYSDVKKAFVSLSAANMFVDQFLSEVFFPQEDEDSRENVDW